MTRLHVSKDERLSQAVDRLLEGGERLLLERDGEDVAALISLEELRSLEEMVEKIEDQIDIEEARRIMADPAEEPIPYDQVRRELDLT